SSDTTMATCSTIIRAQEAVVGSMRPYTPAAQSVRSRELALCPLADHPCAAAAREEADRPAEHDEQPVLEADEVDEVHAEPEDPRGEACDPYALDVGDCLGTADRREVSLVAIPERPRFLPAQAVLDEARRIAALLDGDRRDSRQRRDGAVCG